MSESFKYSMVDEDLQNRQIREKYNLFYSNMTKDVPYLEVIKMLEVKLFSAEASLKLSMELHENYKNIIAMLNKDMATYMGIIETGQNNDAERYETIISDLQGECQFLLSRIARDLDEEDEERANKIGEKVGYQNNF
jgi:predicted DNA-binding ArsR family transcriptional regulator